MGGFFNLKTGKETEQGREPCIHYADGHIWFNIHAQLSVTLTSRDYDRLISLLRRAKEPTAWIEEKLADVSMFFETLDVGRRNLCIADGAIYLVFNLKVNQLLALADFLEKEKEESDFTHRGGT